MPTVLGHPPEIDDLSEVTSMGEASDPQEAPEIKKSKRVPVGVRLPEDKVERLRNAIYWIGQGLTLNGSIEEAVDAVLTRLEKNNGGVPYPQREKPIPKGRS